MRAQARNDFPGTYRLKSSKQNPVYAALHAASSALKVESCCPKARGPLEVRCLKAAPMPVISES